MNDALRPTSWEKYIGQAPVKERLEISIAAAIEDIRPLDHVLLIAPPGAGKTTLAQIIANELEEPFTSITMGPTLKASAWVRLLMNCPGGVLFLDELHRATNPQQEDLLNLLEDGFFTLPNGHRIEFPWLTVIAATTEKDKILNTVRDRYLIQPSFVEYDADTELSVIAEGMAGMLGFALGDELALAIGRASGGTPRNVKRLVVAARDLRSAHAFRRPTVKDVLDLTQTTPDGLTTEHIEYLGCLQDSDGHAGLSNLAARLRLHESVLRDLERLLMKLDLVILTDRGRELTSAGWNRVRPQLFTGRGAA